MKLNASAVLKPALTLFVICLVVTALLAGTNMLTKDRIAEQAQITAEESRRIVLSEADAFEETDGCYTARAAAKSSATCSRPRRRLRRYGAGHDRHRYRGQHHGRRDPQHEETPGLGANAERASFTDQYRQAVPENGITLVKNKTPEAGEVEALTGATITSRAVTDASMRRSSSTMP